MRVIKYQLFICLSFLSTFLFAQDFKADIKKMRQWFESTSPISFTIEQTMKFSDVTNNQFNSIQYLVKKGNIKFKSVQFEGIKGSDFTLVLNHQMRNYLFMKSRKSVGESDFESLIGQNFDNVIKNFKQMYEFDTKNNLKVYSFYNQNLGVNMKLSIDAKTGFLTQYSYTCPDRLDMPVELIIKIKDLKILNTEKSINWNIEEYGSIANGELNLKPKYKTYKRMDQ